MDEPDSESGLSHDDYSDPPNDFLPDADLLPQDLHGASRSQLGPLPPDIGDSPRMEIAQDNNTDNDNVTVVVVLASVASAGDEDPCCSIGVKF